MGKEKPLMGKTFSLYEYLKQNDGKWNYIELKPDSKDDHESTSPHTKPTI